jgi:A/G-specific adenine glycosylase
MQDLKVATGEKRRLFQEAVLCWVTDQLHEYPWRKPGRSPYEILIAEILLKRTTATAAARVYEDFLHKFPSPQAINDADEEKLAQVLSKVGLQWQRAKAVKALAGHLTEVQGGEIPCDLHLLLGIPGLGEYSARAILSFGFGIPVAVVDANIERILGRAFQNVLPRRPSQHSLQVLAGSLLPNKSHRDYNLGLLDLGAVICRYTAPLCEGCPLISICAYYNENKGRLIKEAPGRYETAIGMKLRKLREEKGVGLAKLARLSGVSKLTVIRIESGKTSSKPETLGKLAAALEIEPDQLR